MSRSYDAVKAYCGFIIDNFVPIVSGLILSVVFLAIMLWMSLYLFWRSMRFAVYLFGPIQ